MAASIRRRNIGRWIGVGVLMVLLLGLGLVGLQGFLATNKLGQPLVEVKDWRPDGIRSQSHYQWLDDSRLVRLKPTVQNIAVIDGELIDIQKGTQTSLPDWGRIPHWAANDFYPSPDGKKVLITNRTGIPPKTFFPEAYLANIDGTDQHRIQLPDKPSRPYVCIFLPDSRRFFAQYEDTILLFDSASPRPSPSVLRHPALSKIGWMQVLGMDAKGEAVALDKLGSILGNGPGFYHLKMTPPVNAITLRRFTPAESNPDPTVKTTTIVLPPTIQEAVVSLSPNAQQVAIYTREKFDVPPWLVPIYTWFRMFWGPLAETKDTLFVCDTDGSRFRQIAHYRQAMNGGTQILPPRWLPDNRHISYIFGNTLYKSDTGENE
ncbi:MAG: hypothetical protein OHK0029_39940 [Armatimonadaceae bacterium]